jgi:glycosyltransferase involved in cell wall biosynthesis
VEAAAGLPSVHFHITGDVRRRPALERLRLPANVRFTGFLPTDEYIALLRDASLVMCLTTRDHTMQRGACEALSLGRPLVTSSWAILREYFSPGAVFVDNTVEGIRSGITEVLADIDGRELAMREMRFGQARQWEEAIAELARLVEAHGAPARSRRG